MSLFLFGCLLYTPHAFSKANSVSNKPINEPPLKAPLLANITTYGANLFRGGYQASRKSALNPDYIIASSDKVNVNIWGLTTFQATLTVDPNGNIFIPEIGPVHLGGVRSADLSKVVKQKIATVYKDGVESYITLLSSTPITVFVTGEVLRPGQYSGLPTDSVLAYLQQAGGIHKERGSYRRIRIMRGRKVINTVDLYQFLRWGKLPYLRLNDGDTLLVEPQGMTLSVSGLARAPLRFEFVNNKIRGNVLAEFARPKGTVTHVEISGARQGKPWNSYLSYTRFLRTVLEDGDHIHFLTDARSTKINIYLEGSHKGRSRFFVEKGTRLRELLDYIPVIKGVAALDSIYIKRQSIAKQQKINLEQSLARLSRSVLLSKNKTEGEVLLRAKEAELVLKYVAKAQNIIPKGLLVVSDRGQIGNIMLEDNDIIVIPQVSDVVMVNGEVNIPRAFMFAPNATIFDYIARAGGYTNRAEQVNVLLIKPSGQIFTNRDVPVSAGDQIIVYPKVDDKKFLIAKDIIQVVYQIALAAKVVGL